MGDLDKNIHRKDESSPYEKIIVNPVEKDKKEKGESYTSLKNATRTQIFATLVSCFKKFLFTVSSKEKLSFYNHQHLLENILAFRALLVILSGSDQSHHPDFTEQLTKVWHSLIEDCNALTLAKKGPAEILTKLNFFIAQIQSFPPGADHTLGYYFNHYAGANWIPFPFMELLQSLHREYTASPVISVLQNWITLLDDILTAAGIRLPSG